MRNQIVFELAEIEGFDQKQLSANKKMFKQVLASTLEKILCRNKYKSSEVKIDKRFSTVSEEKDANPLEEPSEFEQHKFIKYKLNKKNVQSVLSLDVNGHQNKPDSEKSVEINLNKIIPRKQTRNFIQENIGAVMNHRSVLRIIMEANQPLSSQNIPYLASETNFSRAELHTFYTIYKALCHATCHLYDSMQYSRLA